MSTVQYRYRASTTEGRVVEGVVQAASERIAIEELRRQRLYPVDVARIAPPTTPGRRGKTGRNAAVALFARTLATMLAAGTTLERAITFAADHSGNADIASAGRDLRKSVQEGATLAEALGQRQDLFGSLFVAMVAAGEESGALDESMERLADHLDQNVELRAQIRSSLIYPALMAAASAIGVGVLLLFVIPRFGAMLSDEGGTLPLTTRVLIGTSTFVLHFSWAFAIVTAALAVGGRSWLSKPENQFRWQGWRLRLPIAGPLETKYMTARFARAMGMLLRSGRPVVASLHAARATVANVVLGSAIERAAEAVRGGTQLHVALTGVLPPLATELIAVGEESGRLDELCLRVADAYESDVRRSLRSAVAIIEPALILLFGLIVGFVALAMLQAIYSINRSML